ncbi:DUF4307 domain-containing protein [Streptomyces meridianus]|uniref:DUF4307 domain-containing protein n=1 Tax=Streptomyces meridianus TaxID=2938945 RepID=A0ABT0X7U7_9ACTN|nr:DUF4307 domain-containing protein [Streptomyces meridianus]MCM2577849.1 DUF4307 domain-containing protein [Streptomyces meridianus]
MTATRDGSPRGVAAARAPGRYGVSADADAAADRRLKAVGAVLGTLLVAFVAWSGFSYVSGQDVSGEMIKFKVVSDRAVDVHLEVRKEPGVHGVCTVRALDVAKGEVGRKDVRFTDTDGRVDRVTTVRTTKRATAAELIGCTPAGDR